MCPRWFGLALVSPLVVACAPHVVRTPSSIPAAVQLQIGRLPRVWVAGFVAHAPADSIDLNVETVRVLRDALRSIGSVPLVDAEPLQIQNEQVFADDRCWSQLGEEHGFPLIVTGSISMFLAPPAIVQRGIRTIYVPTAGRVLDATVVLIDGRTGHVVDSIRLPRRMRYGVGRFSSGLSLFINLMSQSRTDWLKAISRPSTTAQSESGERTTS